MVANLKYNVFCGFFFFFKFNRENESFRLKISTENSKMLEIEKS